VSHVLLIGFMGAGKSTVGRLLAERLGIPFIDLDGEIERAAGGVSVSEIFSTSGEAAFREFERVALRSVADRAPAVVACGGGVVLDDDNRRMLRALGSVVYLEVDADEALARIGTTAGRPLLEQGNAAETARALLSARETLYRSTADIVIDTSGLEPEAVAEQAFERLAGAGPEAVADA
jgi:shikimate kinase